MAAPEKELLATARKLASLQVKQRKLKGLLKLVQADIRHERKMLKALASVPRVQSAPSRTFGNGVGHALPKVKSERKPFNGDTSVEAFVDGLDGVSSPEEERQARIEEMIDFAVKQTTEKPSGVDDERKN